MMHRHNCLAGFVRVKPSLNLLRTGLMTDPGIAKTSLVFMVRVVKSIEAIPAFRESEAEHNPKGWKENGY